MIVLDTSALLRFFTADDEEKAKKVKALLESDEELILIDAVLLELAFSLIKIYKQPKDRVLEVMKYLTSRANVQVSSEMKKALGIYQSKNMSVTDCLVVVYGEDGKIASFDENLLKMHGVKSVWNEIKSRT